MVVPLPGSMNGLFKVQQLQQAMHETMLRMKNMTKVVHVNAAKIALPVCSVPYSIAINMTHNTRKTKQATTTATPRLLRAI